MASVATTPDAVSQLGQCLIHGRISKPDGILRLVLRLDTFPEHQALDALARLIEIVAASPHNRHAVAGRAGLVNALILNLSRFSDALRPPLLKLLLLAGRQRFTVHDTRAALAQVCKCHRLPCIIYITSPSPRPHIRHMRHTHTHTLHPHPPPTRFSRPNLPTARRRAAWSFSSCYAMWCPPRPPPAPPPPFGTWGPECSA
jgi:hypothetical protein